MNVNRRVTESYAILVNVKNSSTTRESLKDAASSAWPFRGERQKKLLDNAPLIIAVVNNHIEAVFENLGASVSADSTDRVEFSLGPHLPLAALVGHYLPATARWKQGERSPWKVLSEKELHSLADKARGTIERFGPYDLKLTGEGTLQVTVPSGYNVELLSAGAQRPAKERIEEAVLALAETEYLTTYGTLAKALGINSPQGVGRSITRNPKISKAAAARVFNQSYVNETTAIIPDDNMSTLGDDNRSRPEILADSGLARLENHEAVVSLNSVILDPVVLRLILKI